MAESPFQELDPIQEEEDLLVVLGSGQHVRLSRPIEVIDGGVSGLSHHNPNGQDFRRAQRVTVPLADVEELRVRRTDEVATSLLVAGGVTGVLFGTFYLFAQEVD